MAAKTAERVQFLADVLTTAVEGGTGYWAAIGGYKFEPASEAQAFFHIEDEPDRQPEFVGLDAIAKGIGRVLDPEFKVRADIREQVALGSRENDAGEIDADGADVIVQAAIFGEIVYG